MITQASLIGSVVGAIVVSEILAPGPLGALRGTLTRVAEASAPVVLILPGSGPTDRDGNNPFGIRAATYRHLSDDLAAEGVTSIRIDKRGMFGSASAVKDANAVTIEDYVDDVRSWVDVAQRETGAKCVWLLGHSEGGLVALAASDRVPDICGLVLVATAGRNMGEVLKDQLRSNPANAELLPRAMTAIDELSAGRRVAAEHMPPALAALLPEQVQGFLISAFRLDPRQLVAAVKKPVLILQGRRDIQVGVKDAQALHDANASSHLVLLSDTNHVLKQVDTDDVSANLMTYANATLPLAPDVARTIASFVKTSPNQAQ